ncbi:MAG: YecA family protein [Enterobacteriaceae bacterium]
MLITTSLPDYHAFSSLLSAQGVAMTAAEMHGLISGMLCGGTPQKNWQDLLQQLTNDGQSFTPALSQAVQTLYGTIQRALEQDGFSFSLWLPDQGQDDEALFKRADALSEWVNHFLLGLAVRHPRLGHAKGEVAEALKDLRNIARLGYDDEDDKEELQHALEEVIEYVRIAAMLCHNEFVFALPEEIGPEQPRTLH